MTKKEFYNRMVALREFDNTLFKDAGAGMYNLDLYETEGVIFDYTLQQTIVQVYFEGDIKGDVYYLCYYKHNNRWDSECLEPNERLYDTIFENILKEYNLIFEMKNNIPTFAKKKNMNRKNLYTVQINLDAYIPISVVAESEEKAIDMAHSIFADMSEEEVIKQMRDVHTINTTYVSEDCKVTTELYDGRTWEVYPYLHTPNTLLFGYNEYYDIKEDWFVANTPKGELWMNNNHGYMFILDKEHNRTYITRF